MGNNVFLMGPNAYLSWYEGTIAPVLIKLPGVIYDSDFRVMIVNVSFK